jgi:hypothetical protein
MGDLYLGIADAHLASGQWRAMRDGNAGSHGTYGNVDSVSYRIHRS